MTRFVGALDQGTTSTRFIVFDRAGALVAAASASTRSSIRSRAGSSTTRWRSVATCARSIDEAVARRGSPRRPGGGRDHEPARDDRALGPRAPAQPVHNAIVWQDTRTARSSPSWRDGGRDRLRARTGLPLSTYFSGPKAALAARPRRPGARARAEAGELLFGTIDTWLIWKLTGGPDGGVHVTDVHERQPHAADGPATLDWDDGILRRPSGSRARCCREIRSSSRGLRRRAPARRSTASRSPAILGDQQAALFGQACFAPGEAKNTYGTGCFLLVNTGEPIVPRSGLLTTVAYRLGDAPAALRARGLDRRRRRRRPVAARPAGLIDTADEVEALAASGRRHRRRLLRAGLLGPVRAVLARATRAASIVGLTALRRTRHLARAALEATAWQTREVLDAMAARRRRPVPSLKVDGGMTVNELLMQFQADVLGVPVVRPQVAETTALGAAYAAGLAVGFWASLDACAATGRPTSSGCRRWTPRIASAAMPPGRRRSRGRSTGWSPRDPAGRGRRAGGGRVVPRRDAGAGRARRDAGGPLRGPVARSGRAAAGRGRRRDAGAGHAGRHRRCPRRARPTSSSSP